MQKLWKAVLHISNALQFKKIHPLAKRVAAEMAKNAETFKTPDPPVATLNAEADILATQMADAEGGDHAKIEIRNAQSGKVFNMLRDEAAYVNKVASGDKAIILLSGFEANDESDPLPIPGKTVVKRIEVGAETHSAKLIIDSLPDAKYYKIEISTTPSDESSWKLAVDNVSSRSLIVRRLTRGQEVWFRVAGGNSHGWGDWSEPASFIAW